MSKEKTSPKRKRTLGQWLDSPNVSGYVFVGPFIIGFLAFMMVPMLLSFAFSFTRYNILQSPTFIGLENYITMFTDDPKFCIRCHHVLRGIFRTSSSDHGIDRSNASGEEHQAVRLLQSSVLPSFHYRFQCGGCHSVEKNVRQ